MAYSLSFTKAILVLAFISDKIRREETDYISAKTMSDLLDIPKPTLVLIFNNLVRAGILESKEGINGGVRFAKREDQISLYDILMAIESSKPLFQTSFDIKANAARPQSIKRKIISSLDSAEEVMLLQLRKTTLKDILR